MANIELKAYRKLLLNFVYYNILFGYTLPKQCDEIKLVQVPRGAYKCSHNAALFIYGNYNLRRTDVVCLWKKGIYPIFLGNLSLKCFLQRNKSRIYSLTPTTKSRRSRTARSASFMQNSERMESSLARIVSLICSQRTDLIYNFLILNFHLINSSCSVAVDRVRNSSTVETGRSPSCFGSWLNSQRGVP